MAADSGISVRPTLSAERVGKAYSASATVLEDVSFSVYPGEFLSIAGPSGCGKTTLLRCVAGLTPPDQGRIMHKGQVVESPPPGLSVVFQDYTRSLFPWLNIQQNVTFGLRQLSKAEAVDRAANALSSVGLTGIERMYPWQLSGGMQQRVALARALAAEPEVLLLDEPFASVDAQTRIDLQDLVMNLSRDLELSVLLVTHDVDEAVYMSDRVLVLSMRPASTVAEVRVQLDYPRDQLTTKESQAFLEARHSVFNAVREQTLSHTPAE